MRAQMRQHREMQKDLSQKLKLKHAALAALPEQLRATASLPDDTPFPMKRLLPWDTPEIPGFFEEKQRQAEEAVSSSAFGGGKQR